MSKTKKDKLHCPRCNSVEGYTRIKTGERVCRYCGNVFDIPDWKGNKKKRHVIYV